MAALKVQLILNRPFFALLRPDQLSALMAAQFGIPSQYRSMLREDIQCVPLDALFRFLVATYAGIVTPANPQSSVLVTVGEKETPIAKMMARRLCRSMIGAKGVIVPAVGHVWNLQAPGLFADVLRAWVTDMPLPTQLLPLG